MAFAGYRNLAWFTGFHGNTPHFWHFKEGSFPCPSHCSRWGSQHCINHDSITDVSLLARDHDLHSLHINYCCTGERDRVKNHRGYGCNGGCTCPCYRRSRIQTAGTVHVTPDFQHPIQQFRIMENLPLLPWDYYGNSWLS